MTHFTVLAAKQCKEGCQYCYFYGVGGKQTAREHMSQTDLAKHAGHAVVPMLIAQSCRLGQGLKSSIGPM